jgi:glycosyltransferase involved in cell wall biosynthesis
MSPRACDLVVVTPVYEDLEASSRLFQELRKAHGDRVHIVAVDDGSVRQPLPPEAIADAGLDGVVIRLRRNVGHQRAIAIGLNYVADQLAPRRVVVMDSDGEDLPASISELERALEGDGADVAVASRRSRVETFRFRAFYWVYKSLFSLLSGRSIDFGNFMMLKPAALARLTAMHEVWIHVAAGVLTSKLRIAAVPLDRGPRYAGQSKMNFVGLALHGFKALMVVAEDVLVRVGIACTLVAVLSVVGVITAIFLKIIGFATPGWFSVALGIMLLVFLQTGTLTLMTLMLTGVVRSGTVASIAWRDFVEIVLPARSVTQE